MLAALPPLAQALGLVRLQMFFTGLTLAFGLLHLLLYAALPRARAHLFYGGFLLAFAASLFLDFEALMARSHAVEMALLRGQRLAMAATLVLGLRFVYALFRDEAPAAFRWAAVVVGAAGLAAAAAPLGALALLHLAALGVFAAVAAELARAVRARLPDARLVAAGFAAFGAFTLYDLLGDLGALPAVGGLQNAYQFGSAALFVAMSAHLARDVARTQARMLEQERQAHTRTIERQRLRAELAHAAKELAEARALQLAMLPEGPPACPGLAVAAHIEAATEVGGDYYDFLRRPGNELTVAVGDATGHGMRAGLLVAVAKSLVNGLGAEEPLPAFLRRASALLKGMRLGPMFFGLTLARVAPGRLVLAAAGMPPALLWRAASGAVETLTLKGMPLGAFPDFPYDTLEAALAPGDTLLLMSDGLPELFDEAGRMLDTAPVAEALAAAAPAGPDAVADRLRALADGWRGNRPPSDDVTFVVVQVTG